MTKVDMIIRGIFRPDSDAQTGCKYPLKLHILNVHSIYPHPEEHKANSFHTELYFNYLTKYSIKIKAKHIQSRNY